MNDETTHLYESSRFTIAAAWDDEAEAWTGHCETSQPLLTRRHATSCWQKISATALDLLPDNHPGVDPESVYLQLTALREAALATL